MSDDGLDLQQEGREDPAIAIDRLAAELAGVEKLDAAGAIEFAQGGNVFAIREGAVHTFRLRPEIVRAGLRTPATARSTRGAEWISLRSGAGDDFTLDRAKAWFELAWRLAGGAPRPVGPDDDEPRA